MVEEARLLPPFFMLIVIRLALSLLVSSVLFTGLTMVSFGHLFNWLEAEFYAPRIVLDYQKQLVQDATALQVWKNQTQKAFKELIGDKEFLGSFNPTLNREEILARNQVVQNFLDQFRPGASLRLVDDAVDRIHYSSLETDILNRGRNSITYKRLIDFPEPNPWNHLKDQLKIQPVVCLYDNQDRQFIFTQPWTDTKSQISGYFIFNWLPGALAHIYSISYPRHRRRDTVSSSKRNSTPVCSS